MKEPIVRKVDKSRLIKLVFLLVAVISLACLVEINHTNYEFSYSDFDCTQVTGSQVRNVYKQLKGTPCAILVYPRDYLTHSYSKDFKYTTSLGINFNAVLAEFKGHSIADDNKSYIGNDFKLLHNNTGNYIYSSANSDKSHSEINSVTSKDLAYCSKLIKSTDGKVIGIVFIEVNAYRSRYCKGGLI